MKRKATAKAKQERRSTGQGGGQPQMALAMRREISDRLRYFVFDVLELPSQATLAKAIGTWETSNVSAPQATVSEWFGSDPRVPSPYYLLLMAERLNLNPRWLLLGTGPELLGAEAALEPSAVATLTWFRAAHDSKYQRDGTQPPGGRLDLDLYIEAMLAEPALLIAGIAQHANDWDRQRASDFWRTLPQEKRDAIEGLVKRNRALRRFPLQDELKNARAEKIQARGSIKPRSEPPVKADPPRGRKSARKATPSPARR